MFAENLNGIEKKKQTYKRTGNCGLFDWEENTAKLCSLGNPLEKLLKVVDFEMFRETLEAGLYKEKLTNVGAKPYDYVPNRIEHVFGYCEQSMRGMFSRAVGFARNAARNILTSLVYNMMRYEQIPLFVRQKNPSIAAHSLFPPSFRASKSGVCEGTDKMFTSLSAIYLAILRWLTQSP